ncbi:MAG: tRNA guanosine(15) transglycosylase TgtA [Nitrososphaerales archaeon]
MPITFEVRETDLMGRNGVLKVGGRSLETPCLVPVVHPVLRDIPLAKFTEMGFGALMTNAFITYRRRREEALEKGLHGMLGYDGAIMTDSGGYQVLRYGQVDMTPATIAEFQSAAGSDLAVTLDRPTGYSLSEEYARETMRVSLEGARETIERFGSSKTTWVGPIQGGLFSGLVRESARGLLGAGFEVLALGSPVELMDNYLFSDLVRMIVAARRAMPYSVPLHLFGAGHPLTMPLSVALGCDTFDSASYVLFARQGRYMTERGTLMLEEMANLPCSCPVCNSTTKTDLVLMERRERVSRLSLHNLYLLRQDVLRCREAISEGRLWDLVEERASTHPRAAAAFRELAANSEWLAGGTPFLKERGLLIRSELDLVRPELATARAHLAPMMRKRVRGGAEGAVLIAGQGGERPLSRSSLRQRLEGTARGRKGSRPPDVYKLHQQLGPYPAELEFVYPFTQTVAEGTADAAQVRDAVARLRSMGYSKVVVLKGRGEKRGGGGERASEVRPAAKRSRRGTEEAAPQE